MSTNFSINGYKSKKIGKKYLITADHGTWTFLDKTDYDSFRFSKLDENKREEFWSDLFDPYKDFHNPELLQARNQLKY